MEYDRHSLSGYSISHFLEETENCINALFNPIEKPKKAEAQLKKKVFADICLPGQHLFDQNIL